MQYTIVRTITCPSCNGEGEIQEEKTLMGLWHELMCYTRRDVWGKLHDNLKSAQASCQKRDSSLSPALVTLIDTLGERKKKNEYYDTLGSK